MDTQRTFTTGHGTPGSFHSLPALAQQGFTKLHRLPVSIRIVLESLLRNADGRKVTERDIANLAGYDAKNPGDYEIPFTVARIVLQDFTGVPLLVDLAAMRSTVSRMGKDAGLIEPLVPVDLVVDHSVQVDFSGSQEALDRNLAIEFARNRERYEFLKWGQQAFKTFSVVPPGIGIVHQVNLEYLARGVCRKEQSNKDGTGGPSMYFPDTLVGTDSHTTMINGLGVVGWGVGGIEAEAGMLGQPVTFLVPEVVGVFLTGNLQEGVTATDLALHVTQMLRRHGVVGKFVEFYGPGARALPLPDRATIANMAPEYGATMGFFPIDEECAAYLRATGRPEAEVATFENYFKAQQLWGIPDQGEIDYSSDLALDLNAVRPSVAGPKRPQDRIELQDLRERFTGLLEARVADGGFGKTVASRSQRHAVHLDTAAGDVPNPLLEETRATKAATIDTAIGHGSVLIASITSCTNTSNPSVMLAAGLLAKKAVQKGLTVPPFVKTSLAPGSRVVTDYLTKTGLQPYLNQLGFQTVGYGCATCIGNSGPLHPALEKTIKEHDLVCASVLSGNRNFEARVHGSLRANFLMSPPLVVAFALAGRADIDLTTEPLGTGAHDTPVFLKDIWPTLAEIRAAIASSMSPEAFRQFYTDFTALNPKWNEIPSSAGAVYRWNAASTYIQEPPFFENFTGAAATPADITGARPLGIFGDSVTTDHISPAGSIKPTSPAGRYLLERGVSTAEFNSYGARRGNDRVMTRGTFANVRIRNLMVPGTEGGYTIYWGSADVPSAAGDVPSPKPQPAASGRLTFIYDAAMAYQQDGTPLVVIGGEDYGMGSSRDWAAKGTRLLGVCAVITKSFERIHRSNLIGMGVLPLNFVNKEDYDKVKDLADATFDIIGLTGELKPMQDATLVVHSRSASRSAGVLGLRSRQGEEGPPVISPSPPVFTIPLKVRLDTPAEVDYYLAGGILPYVLGQILG